VILNPRTINSQVGKLISLVLLAAPAAIPSQLHSNRLEFEVASIRENRQAVPWQDNRGNCGLNGMGSVNILAGGRLRAERALLACVIQGAYAVRPYQVVGGPDWVNSIHFDVDAKAANASATTEEVRLMLQALLADRFRLQLHKETRNIPAYVLSIAKGGTRLRPPTAGNCSKPGSLTATGGPTPPSAGKGPAPMIFPCGRMGGTGSPGGSRMDGGEVPIAELVRLLTLQLKRPVIDKTDLKGTFDIHLTYVGTNPLSAPPTTDEPSAQFGLTIFDAIEKQLGLKLEASRTPSDVLVIDGVQEPSQN
jgi:uncharacterized protein (TIGR03435 family)